LVVHELFVKLPTRFALTKILRDENYLQGILRANVSPLDGARFFMPNLVFSPGASGAERWVRWCVPVDDSSYVEFTFLYFEESPIPGEPRDAAQAVLLKAIEEICAQRRVASESAAKDR
jgi:hypothetical protein